VIDSLRRDPLLAGLALLAAALAVVIGIEIASGGVGASIPAPSARRAAPAEAKLLPPLIATAPEQAYPEMAARPLWIPTRRPAPQATAAAAAFARGQFVLQGVTIAGGTRIALLREKVSGRVHRVEKGKDVNGIQVVEIEPDKVVLAQGGEREELELRVQKPGGAVPGTAAFAPAPALALPGAAGQGPFAATPAPGASAAQSPVAAPRRVPQVTEAVAAQPAAPSAIAPGAASPAAAPVPQQATTAPMTPEELLARRRARRTQSPQ